MTSAALVPSFGINAAPIDAPILNDCLPAGMALSRLAINRLAIVQSGISLDVIAEERELIAAEPGEEIAWPSDRAEALSDDLQDTIPDGVAVEIIDALEIIEVDQEECVPAADERRRSRHRFQRVEDHPPGGEIRQQIPRRLPPEFPQPGCCSNFAHHILPLFI